MFNPSIDLGQLIVAVLIAIVGYFLKKTIDTLSTRLDRHDNILFKLAGDVQRLIGFSMRNEVVNHDDQIRREK